MVASTKVHFRFYILGSEIVLFTFCTVIMSCITKDESLIKLDHIKDFFNRKLTSQKLILIVRLKFVNIQKTKRKINNNNQTFSQNSVVQKM